MTHLTQWLLHCPKALVSVCSIRNHHFRLLLCDFGTDQRSCYMLHRFCHTDQEFTLMRDLYFLFSPVQTAVGLTKQRTQWRTSETSTPAASWVTILAKTAMAQQVQRQSTETMFLFLGGKNHLLVCFICYTAHGQFSHTHFVWQFWSLYCETIFRL